MSIIKTIVIRLLSFPNGNIIIEIFARRKQLVIFLVVSSTLFALDRFYWGNNVARLLNLPFSADTYAGNGISENQDNKLSADRFYSQDNNIVFNRKNGNQKREIVEGESEQSKPLQIIGKQNVVIKGSVLKNIKDRDAIVIKDSDNVKIENAVIDNVSGKNNLSGIRIHNSTNVTIANSTISRILSSGHSAGIKITGSRSADIIIDRNHIYDTNGNGIVSGGCSDCAATQTIHDTPVPRLKVTKNLIHDTGKTVTPKPESPTHGMYIKAQDAYIADNKIYNAFDGEGISIRSTAIVRNNKVWDTKLAAIGFLQMKPPGSSMKSIIEDNELFFTENRPQGTGWGALLLLNWSKKSSYPLRYENFVVRNNKLAICTSEVGDLPLIKLYPFSNLTIINNQLVDRREHKHFFDYFETSLVRYENSKVNSFNSSSCP